MKTRNKENQDLGGPPLPNPVIAKTNICPPPSLEIVTSNTAEPTPFRLTDPGSAPRSGALRSTLRTRVGPHPGRAGRTWVGRGRRVIRLIVALFHSGVRGSERRPARRRRTTTAMSSPGTKTSGMLAHTKPLNRL
jgi:hypothetical protein